MKGRIVGWTTTLLLTVNFLTTTGIDALLCYCTEDECLSGERSNMCVQENPALGCYKQYYSKIDPPIIMGCVKFELLCDSSRIRPGPYKSEWPHTACCYTDHCNRHLPLPTENQTDLLKETTILPVEEISVSSSKSPKLTVEMTTPNKQDDAYSSASVQETVVHPVFLLLIVLVVIFLIVVMASVLVIMKIWFYRRKKSKPQKRWVIQQNMLRTKAQMSHLLTDEQYESPVALHQSSKANTVSSFDVP